MNAPPRVLSRTRAAPASTQAVVPVCGGRGLGDEAGVVRAEEAGFLKRGVRAGGAERQFSGTAGRTETCQIGPFLCSPPPRGGALTDGGLSLPVSWTNDRERCRAAAVP